MNSRDDHAHAERAKLREYLIGLFGDSSSRLTTAKRHLHAWRTRSAWRACIGGAEVAKRTIDVVVALAAIAALLPLFALVAVLIRRHDGGPILFWQTRVGRWGREFPCPKFRSMVADAERLKASLLALNDHANGVTFKMRRDPRVTPIGRAIRKLSIDELPQLWCILRGEMSLVGPRPPVPREVAAYTLADRRRLEVTPGLTCIWQVSGRGDLAFDKQVELDVDYIHARNLRMDLSLLLRTVPAVLSGRGAY